MIVDDHRVGHGTQIEEMMPVAIVPRQPRCFEGQHSAGLAAADGRQQLSEAGPIDQAAAALAEIFVNDHDAREAQLPCAVGQRILPLLAFAMVAHLLRRGLTHINVGRALQMFGLKLVIHGCSFRRARLGCLVGSRSVAEAG